MVVGQSRHGVVNRENQATEEQIISVLSAYMPSVDFQVNLNFLPRMGQREAGMLSASSTYGVYKARTLGKLLKKIMKETGLKAEQIILTFQSE